MAVLLLPAGFSAAQHKTAMRDAAVVPEKFLLTDKMYLGVVVCKIIRHGLDFLLHFGGIRPFFQNDKTLSCMFFPSGKLGVFSLPHSCKRRLHGNRVLFGIFHACNPADRVGMPLAYALSPECIVFAVWQNSAGIHPV